MNALACDVRDIARHACHRRKLLLRLAVNGSAARGRVARHQ